MVTALVGEADGNTLEVRHNRMMNGTPPIIRQSQPSGGSPDAAYAGEIRQTLTAAGFKLL